MTSSRRLIPEVDDLAAGDVIGTWTPPPQFSVKSDFWPAAVNKY